MFAAIASLAALCVPEPGSTSPVVPAQLGIVRWEAPASCPTQAEVEAAIGARVPVAEVRVHAQVAETGDGFAADVTIDSARGMTARTLTSPSCTSIVDALALLAHVAAEPLPTPEIIAPSPAPDSTLVPEPIPDDPRPRLPAAVDAPPANRESPQPRPHARRVHATLAVSAAVGGGTLPTIDVGVLGAAGLAHRVGRVELGAIYLGQRRGELDLDAEVELDAWGLALRVCPAIPLAETRPRLALGLCVGGYAGQLRGASRGDALDAPRAAARPWVRVAAGPELAIALNRRVRVIAAVEVGGHVVRPGFAIAGLGRIWAPQRWSAHGLVGVQVRL